METDVKKEFDNTTYTLYKELAFVLGCILLLGICWQTMCNKGEIPSEEDLYGVRSLDGAVIVTSQEEMD